MNEHPSTDQLLLDRLNEAIEENLQNEQFGVPELADAAGLSKSQLNRKLQSLTTQSASQFIREYRLKKAMELLQSKAAAPTEVAYKVGFGSPSYFSTCFKEYYGYSPTEVKYRENEEEPKGSTGKNKKKKYVILSLGVILILAIAFVFNGIFARINRLANETGSSVTIAVLPFNFAANDLSQEVYAQLIAGDIAEKLSNISQLTVIASSFIENLNVREIEQNYNADFLLKISFTIIKESFNLRAEIMSAADGKMIWSMPYERPINDLQDIQSDVALAIGVELGLDPTPKEKEKINEKATQSDKAYAYYLLGSDYLGRLPSEENMRTASNYFEKAIALDSGFAKAWIGAASANQVLYSRHHDRSDEQLKKAQRYFDKARSLDPDLLQVKLRMINMMESEKALQTLYSLLEEYPENDTIYKRIGGVFSSMRQFDKALENVERAIELNPANFHHYVIAAINCNRLRRYNKAIEYYETAVELMPEYAFGQMASLYLTIGDIEKAKVYLDERVKIYGGMERIRSHVEIMDRNLEKALVIINEADTIISDGHSSFTTKFRYVGLIYFLMGDEILAKANIKQDCELLESKLKQMPGDPRIMSSLGIAYAVLGQKKRAVDICKKSIEITEFKRLNGLGYRWEDLSLIYLINGEYQECINVLEWQLKNSEEAVERVKLNPFWDPLREMPEFQAMINNPEYAPVP